MSSLSATSCRARRAVSLCSRSACCFLGPLTWPGFASRLSSVPNSLRNVLAKPAPMPGTPGTLSTESPVSDQVIDDLVGADAPILLEARGVHHLVLADVVDADLVADQLAGVLVGGDDEDVQAALLAAAGEGGDHVVGLHERLHEDRHAKALEDRANHRNLRDQVDGHLLAGRLVFRKDLRAKDRARPVEGGGQVVRLLVAQQVEQVAKDSEDGLGRLAGGLGHHARLAGPRIA